MRNVQAACDTDLPHTERAEHLQKHIAPAQRFDGLRRNEVALRDRLAAGRDRQRAERLPGLDRRGYGFVHANARLHPGGKRLVNENGRLVGENGRDLRRVPSVTGTAGSSPGSGVTSA